jgi:diphthamide synthase (EF-2-diphthine--ammonia ligase)
MVLAALTSRGKDSIHSCQKAIDSGKEVRYFVTAADGRDAGLPGARFNDALIRYLKQVAWTRHINLAGEGGEYESLTLNAPFYPRPVTCTTSEIRSAPGRSERVPGGFA